MRLSDVWPRRAAMLLAVITSVCAVAFVVVSVLFSSYFVPSTSMEPTIEPGSHILVSRFDDAPARGDVVVFRHAAGSFTRVVARVVGLGGDHLESIDGILDRNGVAVPESYLAATRSTEGVDAVTVPDGHMYLMGDNRRISQDSRFFGPLPTTAVVGVAVVGQPRWHRWTLGALVVSGALMLWAMLTGPPRRSSDGSG